MKQIEFRILEEVNIKSFIIGVTVVINIRHQQELLNTQNDLDEVIEGVDNGVTNDFTAIDSPARPIRRAPGPTAPGRDHQSDHYR